MMSERGSPGPTKQGYTTPPQIESADGCTRNASLVCFAARLCGGDRVPNSRGTGGQHQSFHGHSAQLSGSGSGGAPRHRESSAADEDDDLTAGRCPDRDERAPGWGADVLRAEAECRTAASVVVARSASPAAGRVVGPRVLGWPRRGAGPRCAGAQRRAGDRRSGSAPCGRGATGCTSADRDRRGDAHGRRRLGRHHTRAGRHLGARLATNHRAARWLPGPLAGLRARLGQAVRCPGRRRPGTDQGRPRARWRGSARARCPAPAPARRGLPGVGHPQWACSLETVRRLQAAAGEPDVTPRPARSPLSGGSEEPSFTVRLTRPLRMVACGDGDEGHCAPSRQGTRRAIAIPLRCAPWAPITLRSTA